MIIGKEEGVLRQTKYYLAGKWKMYYICPRCQFKAAYIESSFFTEYRIPFLNGFLWANLFSEEVKVF
jgi:hypothetical protein